MVRLLNQLGWVEPDITEEIERQTKEGSFEKNDK